MANESDSWCKELSKGDNRINLSFFGCMLIHPRRSQILERLGLCPNTRIRPARA